MGLVNSDVAVCHLALALKHLQLDDPVCAQQPIRPGENSEAVQLFFNRLEVSFQLLNLGFDPFPDTLF